MVVRKIPLVHSPPSGSMIVYPPSLKCIAMPALGTILVIEHDRATRELFAELLGDEGYSVRVVSDALGGIVALADEQPDLILVDYHLPRTNALAFARSIRSMGIGAPIVLVTADNHPPDHPDMAYIAFCVLKPFGPDELLASIAAHIHVSPAQGINPHRETSKR